MYARYKDFSLKKCQIACQLGFIFISLSISTLAFSAPQHAFPISNIQAFLQQYWQKPIPLQGKAPADFSPLEVSQSPESCGLCHRQQYEDWKTTRHSKSMGPGVVGQFVGEMKLNHMTIHMCNACHAPLSEQYERLPTIKNNRYSYITHTAFDRSLQHKGLVCAACHVRQHKRFGPPPNKPSLLNGQSDVKLPHGGFVATSAFTKSKFCKGCHQFNNNDPRLNGKLFENTYQEWLQSSYAKEGTQCQNCHMPDRRHLFRGIHDPETVRKGIQISLDAPQKPVHKGEQLKAHLTIKNTGVGHLFPTYLTPKVFIDWALLDKQGKIIAGTTQRDHIGREATIDLSKELYDTRIPPGKSLTFNYTHLVPQDNAHLKVKIVVHPDHFYARHYETKLKNYRQKDAGYILLKRALQDAKKNIYTLYESE